MSSKLIEAPISLKKNYLTGLKEALFEEMSGNKDMIVMGEDIGLLGGVGSSRVDLQACKLEYSIVSPK